MDDKVRLIDANSLCAKIVQSIHDAEEWINEAKERQDIHGLRCATEAKTSLLAMLTRIHDEPTIEAEPENSWISVDDRPPEDDVDVLLHDKYCGTLIGWYDKEDDVFKTDYISQLEAVTRWMPLPEEPKEE